MASLLPAMALLAWGNARFAGYIKDDAFISLRYAKHLASGEGLVFNLGDQPLEGYSNFLWVVLEAMGLWSGVEGHLLASGLSMCFAISAVIYAWLLAAQLAPRHNWAVAGLAAAALAAHPTLLLWSQGGLAGPLLATCFAGGFYHLARDHADDLAMAILWSVIACLVRPEGHLLWIASALFLLLRPQGQRAQVEPAKVRVIIAALLCLFLCGAAMSIVSNSFETLTMQWLASMPSILAASTVMALIFVPLRYSVRRWSPMVVFLGASLPLLTIYHGWRLHYFGDLFPNTSHVKMAGGWALYGPGGRALQTLGLFCGTGLALLLAALALRPRPSRALRLLMLSIVLVFAFYLVHIGGDEMSYSRIVLPALPLLLVLASLGWHQLNSRLATRVASRALCALPLAFFVCCFVVVESQQLYASTHRGLQSAHEAMAQSIARRSAPGERVVFQDMGAAPLAADSLEWIDPIGLVNRPVALLRKKYDVNPFQIDSSSSERIMAQVRFRAELRDYLFGLEPEWIAGVIYLELDESRQEVAELVAQNPAWSELKAQVGTLLDRSPHYHRLFADPRFARHYRFDSAWQRSATYYLLLFRRTD